MQEKDTWHEVDWKCHTFFDFLQHLFK